MSQPLSTSPSTDLGSTSIVAAPGGALRARTLYKPWGEVRYQSGALLDRLTHHCHMVQFEGDSYRFRQSLSRQSTAAPGEGIGEG